MPPEHVWATENKDDRFADWGLHGKDPTRISFGSRVFESNPAPGTTFSDAHSDPLDKPGSGLDNLGRIINGDPQNLPPPVPRQPVPLHDEFGSVDDDPQ